LKEGLVSIWGLWPLSSAHRPISGVATVRTCIQRILLIFVTRHSCTGRYCWGAY